MSRELFTRNPDEKHGFDYQMCILSVIGIFFVILGHLKNDGTSLGTFNGWFPYYSFHLPIFLFISGYFFRDLPTHKAVKGFTAFVWKKMKTLLLPYFVINGLFLLFNLLAANWGFTYGYRFSLVKWLLYPWTRLYVVTYSAPTWYLIGFFIAEIYFCLLRQIFLRILKKDLLRELALWILTLFLGIAAIYYNNSADLTETAQVYLRSVPMLFFLQTGFVYRNYLKKKDTLKNVWYFLILFAAQFLLIVLLKNDAMNPQLYELTGFDRFGMNYFIAGIAGIALWLRISRLIVQIPGKSRLLIFIGNNTKYIMSFHVFGFFLLNGLLEFLYKNKIGMTFLKGFSSQNYHTYLYYSFIDNPRMILLYFLAGLGVSLAFAKGIELVRNLLYKRVSSSL